MKRIQSEAALGSNEDWPQHEKEALVKTMRALFPPSPLSADERLALVRKVIAEHREVLERLKDR